MRIYLDSIGCRLNQSEIDMFARQFRSAGHTLVASPQDADIAIVNTCSVTSKAESDSRQRIRKLLNAGTSEIVVTGCWATLEPEKAGALSGVSRVVTNPFKDELPDLVLTSFDDENKRNQNSTISLPEHRFRTRTFLKVQDGCNNHCTYCITVLARGHSHSRQLNDVISDIQSARLNGTQEVILSGVQLGSWGKDLDKRQNLHDLVKEILDRTDIPRLRLSSLEPWDLCEKFFELWQNKRLCRHIHLPLQSGCNSTLRRMARRTTQHSYRQLVENIRNTSPDISITTDIIVGFPGETDEEFLESMAFVRSLDFSGGHVFTYSERPGTIAASMPNQILLSIRKKRNAEMRDLFLRSSQRYKQQFIGKTMEILWESAVNILDGNFQLTGLTDNYLRVKAINKENLWNQISNVLLAEVDGDTMIGSII